MDLKIKKCIISYLDFLLFKQGGRSLFTLLCPSSLAPGRVQRTDKKSKGMRRQIVYLIKMVEALFFMIISGLMIVVFYQ